MLKIGLIGCGRFARFYHAPTLLDTDEVRLAAILDPAPSPETSEMAKKNGIAFASSLSQLFQQVDAVIISSPHGLHAEHVMAALAAKRHVLVDKPFVLKTVEAREAAERAVQAGVIAGVAFNRRLDAGCRRAAALIAAGRIGALRHAETVQLGYPQSGWLVDPVLGGGGPFVGRGAHMADLVPWLTGLMPGSVSARTTPGAPGRVDRGGSITLVFADFECQMTCLDRGLEMWDEVRLFGDEGRIELSRPAGAAIGWEMLWHDQAGQIREQIKADTAPGAGTINFLAAIAEGAPIACSFADAVPSVRIIEAAFESAAVDGKRLALNL